MNMKKTIAAVAACVVAVSAIATTVSAEEGTLKYNLVKSVKSVDAGKVTLSATITNGTFTKDKNVTFIFATSANTKIDFTGATFTISGRYTDTGKPFTAVYSNDKKSDNYNATRVTASADGKTFTVVLPVNENSATDLIPSTDAATYTVSVVAKHTYDTYDNISKVNDGINTETTIKYDNTGVPADAVEAVAVASNFTASTEKVTKTPFKTTLSSYKAVTPDIINYLETTAGINGDNSFNNVKAVINDVIANYDDVTFTFNTATSGIKDDKYSDDWDADSQYKSFGQHLYNLYGQEATNYVYKADYDWSYYNLFSGALIINNNLSMSLNDTTTFDYGATSLSFNWEDATEGANVNTYVTYLQTLQLATSTTWYWDSMDVVYADAAADESVESGEGTEAEEDTIGEEEEEVTDEEVVDEAEEEVEAPAEEEAPAAEETNPGTGNAPIALAVIPVALAAAAIVAKKRG